MNRLGAALIALAAAAGSVSLAQEPQQPPPRFTSATSLVLVRFHVARKNRFVTDLTRDDVRLLEDGAERPVTLFEGGRAVGRTIPIQIAVVADTSGSVTDQGLLDPMVYASTLLDALPGVSIGVYGFAKDARRYCAFTRETADLGEAFARLGKTRDDSGPRAETLPTALPRGRTSTTGASWVYESVLAVARDASAAPGPATRLVLVFSDGLPTTTTLPADIVPDLQQLGVSVFPVALGHREIVEEIRAAQENGYDGSGQLKQGARTRLYGLEDRERKLREFGSLGELTGGRSFDPPTMSLDVVRTLLTGLAARVTAEYVVGFEPERASGSSGRHKLEIQLRAKGLGDVLGGKRTIVY